MKFRLSTKILEIELLGFKLKISASMHLNWSAYKVPKKSFKFQVHGASKEPFQLLPQFSLNFSSLEINIQARSLSPPSGKFGRLVSKNLWNKCVKRFSSHVHAVIHKYQYM